MQRLKELNINYIPDGSLRHCALVAKNFLELIHFDPRKTTRSELLFQAIFKP